MTLEVLKALAVILESNFRTGQVTRNKKAKWLNLLTLENWTQWEEL